MTEDEDFHIFTPSASFAMYALPLRSGVLFHLAVNTDVATGFASRVRASATASATHKYKDNRIAMTSFPLSMMHQKRRSLKGERGMETAMHHAARATGRGSRGYKRDFPVMTVTK